MRMIYINRDNKARVSEISSSKNMIEQDGYHPVPSGCVYRNAQNKDDAICIVFQGRVMPFGHSQSAESLEQLNWEIYLTSLLDGRLEVETKFERFIRMLMHNAIPVGVLVLLTFVGISMLTQGGV